MQKSVSGLDDVILGLYDNGGIQLKDFKTKSGITHPIFVNLRVCLDNPVLTRKLVEAYASLLTNETVVCGVPIGTTHIASVFGFMKNMKVVIIRENTKRKGNLCGGVEPNEKVFLVEDVVTTSTSIRECEKKIGQQHITKVCFLQFYKNQPDIKTVTTINNVMRCLYRYNRITLDECYKVMSFFRRKSFSVKSDLTDSLLKSRIILDISTKEDLELLGGVAFAKVHSDKTDIPLLYSSIRAKGCLIIEDRKYADIPRINKEIISFQPKPDIVTCHALSGVDSIPDDIPVLLVMEMSCRGSFFSFDYVKLCKDIAKKKKNVIGFVSQHKWCKGWLCVTPGIHSEEDIDRGIKNGTDVFVIGSIVTKNSSPLYKLGRVKELISNKRQ